MAETELKLAVAPEDVPAFKQALEARAATPASDPQVLNSTYYDSADLALRQHHLTLRIREQDGTHVQTLKSEGPAAEDPLSRGEWEDAVDGDQPSLAAPNSGPRFRDLLAGAVLQPLFSTTVRRTIVQIEVGSATRIEAAIDEGEIRRIKGDAIEPLCEIELELKEGNPAALYELALQLLEVAPLRIEARSKAERGYQQGAADGRAALAAHARPIALDGAMTVEAALQTIGRACLHHLQRNVPAALSGEADAVHQMRVALRRLRSVLSAAKIMLPPAQYRWALNELKWLADSLGPARNWDVFKTALFAAVERALPQDADLKRLGEVAERQRQAAYEGAREAILSRRYTSSLLRLLLWLETRGWRDQPASEQAAQLFAPIGKAAPAFVEHRWRQLRKRSKRFDELSQQQRHRLRIALKKFRYTIESLDCLFDDDDVKAMTKRLKPLQDNLGYQNDVRTARGLVEEMASHVNEGGNEVSRAGGMVLGWHDHGMLEQEPKLRKHIRRLRRAEPFWPRAKEPAAPGRVMRAVS